MRQAEGKILDQNTLYTAAPADNDDKGADLELTQGQAKVAKWLVRIVTTALVDWDLYVRHKDAGHPWSKATSLVQNYAKVNGSAVFVLHDVGIFDRLAVVIAANGTSVSFQEFIENNFLRGD